jgi:hypothetical protein
MYLAFVQAGTTDLTYYMEHTSTVHYSTYVFNLEDYMHTVDVQVQLQVVCVGWGVLFPCERVCSVCLHEILYGCGVGKGAGGVGKGVGGGVGVGGGGKGGWGRCNQAIRG